MICITTAQTILPVLAFGVSILAFAVSFKAYRFSQKAHIANRQPRLVFNEEELQEVKGVISTGFYLRNIGLGPAFNIEIEKRYLEKHDFLKQFGEIPRNIAPNGGTCFNIILGRYRFINRDVTIEVTYEDHEGRPYRTTLKELKHFFK